MKVPILAVMEFQQRDRQDSKNLNSDIFCILPVTSAQCNTGVEKYPDAGNILICDDDIYSQGYGQNKTFRAFTKHDILQPYLSGNDFRSSNVVACYLPQMWSRNLSI